MPDNQIAFPSVDNAVSRHHAILYFDRGQYYIADLDSKNGTFVNGRRIPPRNKQLLGPRDQVQIGANVFQLMPLNSVSGKTEDNIGFIDKISQGLTLGFSKLETMFKPGTSFSDSLKPPPEAPSTIRKDTPPIVINSHDSAKLKLSEKLAAGGMSVIYKAVFSDTKEVVAVKFPKPEVASDPKALQLFKEEIRMSLKFKHPNTVHTLMAIEYNHLPTMVMEYFPSKPLSTIYPQLTLDQASNIMFQAILGLESIHAKQIIHNDIKPGNIIVNQNFQAKICDFGTSGEIKQINKNRKEWDLIGTPLYMSPEQLSAGSPLSFASDIYALCLVLYEVFTKQHPFRSNENTESAIREKQLHAMPPNPCDINPAIPIALGQLIMKGIQKDPRNRFSSIRELKTVFENSF